MIIIQIQLMIHRFNNKFVIYTVRWFIKKSNLSGRNFVVSESVFVYLIIEYDSLIKFVVISSQL